MTSRALAWVRSLSRYLRLRSRFEDEVDEEFRTHIEMRARDLVREGLTPREARLRARTEFGGLEKYKEEGRQARGETFRWVMLLDAFASDVKYACRGLFRARGSSIIAVLAIALGIGLPSVMYAVVHSVVDWELPIENGERIVMVLVRLPQGELRGMLATPQEYLALREAQRSFDELVAYRTEAINLRVGDHAARYTAGVLSINTLDLLSAQPALGRGFTEDDGRPGAPLTVLIGHRAWEEQFGGDPSVLGTAVSLNGESAQVIGVMEEGFGFVFPDEQDVWIPLRTDLLATANNDSQVSRQTDSDGTSREVLFLVGKLREGVTVEQASSEIAAVGAGLEEASGAELPVAGVQVYSDAIMPDIPFILYGILATLMPVLLIASVNVANLLLARAAARSKDMAVRTALGASRARAVSQVLAEATVLSIGGALVATTLAWLGIGMVRRALSASELPAPLLTTELDVQVLAFIALLTAVAALLSAAIPAWRATTADVGAVLKDGSGAVAGVQVGRLTRGLIVAQVSLSLAMLVTAGLMMRNVLALARRDLPVPAEAILTARVAPLEHRFSDPSMRQLLWEDIQGRVAVIPGIRSAAITTSLPGLVGPSTRFMREGDTYATEAEIPRARWSAVSTTFFSTFGTAATQGRVFDGSDSRDAAAVVVVNETFAARYLDGRPIGRRIRVGGLNSEEPWREVVGVVPDLYMAGMAPSNPSAGAGLYVPIAQDDVISPYLVATSSDEPLAPADAIRTAVSQADADTPLYSISTLRALIDGDANNTAARVFGMLFMVFGAAALFMASVGLYGVMSFTVSRRVPELGLRMAVGASATQVRRLVLVQGIRLIVVGAVLGTVLAWLTAASFLSGLFGVNPADAAIYILVIAVLMLAGVIACAVPARRATRLDPMTVLRAS